MRCSTSSSGPSSTKLPTAWWTPFRGRPTGNSAPDEARENRRRGGIRSRGTAHLAPRAAARREHAGGRARGERPGGGGSELRPGTRRNLREGGSREDRSAGRRQGGNLQASAGRSQGAQARARGEETREGLISAAGLRDVGARPGFLGFDLGVFHVVALALVVDLRDAAADFVLREALFRVAAVGVLGLRLGALLVGLFGCLCLVLLALAEVLLLVGGSLRGALRRLVGCTSGGSDCRSRRDAPALHGFALHARRAGILRIDCPAGRIEAFVDFRMRRRRAEACGHKKSEANHGGIPFEAEGHHNQFYRASQSSGGPKSAGFTGSCLARIIYLLGAVWSCVWFRRLSLLTTSSSFRPTPASCPVKSA